MRGSEEHRLLVPVNVMRLEIIVALSLTAFSFGAQGSRINFSALNVVWK
jgi:hypothetical protein